MNRNKIMKFFMIMLPPMAFGLATTMDSLIVFDSVSGVTSYYSYFQQVPGVPMALLAAVAGILCIPGLILAVIAAVKEFVWALSALKWISFASACCAVTPILFRGEVVVVPNVALPILMMVEFILAYIVEKKKLEPVVKAGPRIH